MFNFFAKKEREAARPLFYCPSCGEPLTALNADGDFSCDICHKLYNHDGLMKDYARLVKQNQRLKVNARFHGRNSRTMRHALAVAHERIAILERERSEYLPC